MSTLLEILAELITFQTEYKISMLVDIYFVKD